MRFLEDIFRCSATGKKESLNEKGVLSLTKFDRLVTGGRASACFNELQRFQVSISCHVEECFSKQRFFLFTYFLYYYLFILQDELWQLVELLESFFGTLVGSKVYVSPTGAQRSPTPLRFNNAETFVLQTEGESRWRLYSPVSPLSRYVHLDFQPFSF